MEHDLKTWPEPFAAILDGRKRFELREADRPFAVGDTLLLREWRPWASQYTGREIRARVTYLVPGGRWGLSAHLCVMGIALEPTQARSFDDWVQSSEAQGIFLGRCKTCGQSMLRPEPAGTPPDEAAEIAREAYIKNVERVVKALAAGGPMCLMCGRPATCIGAYERSENLDFGCEECCSHGNEDGWCVSLISRPEPKRRRKPKALKEQERVAGEVVCPKCGAKPGKPCTNGITGEVGDGFHRVRLAASLAAHPDPAPAFKPDCRLWPTCREPSKEPASEPAPACARCRAEEHDKCGGAESGCGCAVTNHGKPVPEPEELEKCGACGKIALLCRCKSFLGGTLLKGDALDD